MSANYRRFNDDDTRIHQAKIDLAEHKDRKKKKQHGHAMYERFDGGATYAPVVPRRMSTFSLKEVMTAKPMSTHFFGDLKRYDAVGDINLVKVRELFEIKNKSGHPAHRISDERIAWVCGWIFGKRMEKVGDEESQEMAFTFLQEVWTSPTFCTFFSPDESRAFLHAESASWMIRLSTTFPQVVRITTEKTNDGITPSQALTIHKKRVGIHVQLLLVGILESLHPTVTDYLGPKLDIC